MTNNNTNVFSFDVVSTSSAFPRHFCRADEPIMISFASSPFHPNSYQKPTYEMKLIFQSRQKDLLQSHDRTERGA